MGTGLTGSISRSLSDNLYGSLKTTPIPTMLVSVRRPAISTVHSNWTTPTGYYPLNVTTMIVPMDGLVSLNYNMPAMVVVAVILFLLVISTAFGNFLVGLALFKYRYLRTISNFLIGNLALSDFLLAITILPLSTVNECLGHWVFGQILCNFWLCADVLYCTASIWNLCVIAFDRFTATLYPVWYREKRSTKQAITYIALVWLLSFGISIPPLLGWNDLQGNYKYNDSTNVHTCELFDTPSYVLYSASGSFYIPFLITVFLYIRIFKVLRKRMQKMRSTKQRHMVRYAEKNLTNSANRVEQDIEMTATSTGNEGVANNEELSSKSLFGSESDGQNQSDDDESSSQNRSDHPLYASGSDAEAGFPLKPCRNGVNAKLQQVKTKDIHSAVILNPSQSVTQSATGSTTGGLGTVADISAGKTPAVNVSISDNLAEVTFVTACPPAITDGNEAKPGKRAHLATALRTLKPFQLIQRQRRMRSSQKRRYEQRETRATIRMAIIIAFFCGMWLGFFVIYIIQGWCCKVPRELTAFFFWLGYSNSCINPILYTIFNEEFRRAFQKILGCYAKNRNTNPRYRGVQRH